MRSIRGIDFGPVWCASGARSFFGGGYWFHSWVPGLNWKGSTFVAKTTTLHARDGNMPLSRFQLRPLSLFPSCIRVWPWKGHALNAVGLSGPGALPLLVMGGWQALEKPFQLSFMSVAATREERLQEAEEFAKLLHEHRDDFASRFALQINLSCPNTQHDPSDLESEAGEMLACFRTLLPWLPLIIKVNALFPPVVAAALDADAICCTNAIPWGKLGHMIPWDILFDSHGGDGPISPLWDLGGGGLSGAPLLPIAAEWIGRLRAVGYEGHINGCGGILKPDDVDVLVKAGANSVSLGTIAMLRGWRIQKTIRRAKELLDGSS